MGRGELSIGPARTREENGRAIQEVDITFVLPGENAQTKTLFYSVQAEYGYGLCSDLSDAYVMASLVYCMRRGLDIVAESPMSSHLYHNVTEYLIPSLVHTDGHLEAIKIHAPITKDSKVRAGKHVGTGMSCGVDSMHALWHYLDYEDSSRRLTHLCITDVGAFNVVYGSDENIKKVKERSYERARTVSEDIDLPLIEIECNIREVLKQSHRLTHTYTDLFSIMMLRYFWKVYYYASVGDGKLALELENNSRHDSGYYEMFILPLVSDGKLDIMSEGFISNRFQKIKDIKDAPYAQKYLYSCVKRSENCGVCSKCLRNLWNLDALGCLDSFRDAYDIDAYLKKRRVLMIKLANQAGKNDFVEDAIGVFAGNKDPDYLYALNSIKKIETAVSDYEKGKNLKRCFRIFKHYRRYSTLAYVYYGKSLLEGKGTAADEELGRKVMESDRARKYLLKHRVSEDDESE
ncbi:MAG: hypothetical protein IKP20_07105 [Candidatus Methanomethylophilaceae archaeon]|nr:hypothetical protein [Candidatus Methanomethylophilaceae archaeon]